MKISDRFTDYGMIGGLFWFLQFIMWFLWTGLSSHDVFHRFIAVFGAIPGPAMSLLGAVGLVVVFTTGLMLDVFSAPFFRLLELFILRNQLHQHAHWFTQLVDLNQSYVQQDFSTLFGLPSYWQVMKAQYTVWRKLDRELMLNTYRNIFGYMKAYVRLDSFLLSYVSLAAGSDKVEILSSQMSLQNNARAIAAGFLICGFEAPLMSNSIIFRGHTSLQVTLLWLFSQYLLMGLAFLVAVGAYQRFCSTLFALIYVISERDCRVEAKPNVPAIETATQGIPKPS